MDHVKDLIELAGGPTKFAAYFVTSHKSSDHLMIPIEMLLDYMPPSEKRAELIDEAREDYFEFNCKMLMKYAARIPVDALAEGISNEIGSMVESEVLDDVRTRIEVSKAT